MANIRPKGKNYQIRVFNGRDQNGKPIISSTTWKPEPGWSEAKVQKELNKFAVEYEKQVRQGMVVARKPPKFYEFADKWFHEHAEMNLRDKTIADYRDLMDRILPVFGHIRIDQIRPGQLSTFYRDLADTSKCATYSCTIDLKVILEEQHKSMTKFAAENNIPLGAVKSAANGRNIVQANAELIAKALEKKLCDCFSAGETNTLSNSTIAKYHRVLSSMFKTAVDWGMVVNNPCDRVSPPKSKVKKYDIVYLSIEEAEKMLRLSANEPPQYRNVFPFLLYTGLRRSEMLGLEWRDYDEESATLRINRTVQYIPGKGIVEDTTKNSSSDRYIQLSNVAVETLKAQKKWQREQRLQFGPIWKDTGKIFTKSTGEVLHPSTVTSRFHDLVEKSDLPPVHLHSLRHSHATILIGQGLPVSRVSQDMGHSSISTTEKIYTHPLAEQRAKVAQTMDDVFGNIASETVKKDKQA